MRLSRCPGRKTEVLIIIIFFNVAYKIYITNWKHAAPLNHTNYQLANDICVAEERSGELVGETVLVSICCICKIVGYVSFVSSQLTVNCTDLSWCVSVDQICSSYQSYLFSLCHLSGKLKLLNRLLLQLTSYLKIHQWPQFLKAASIFQRTK